MAIRKATHFSRAGFPSYAEVDEEGQAQQCVYAVPWVNPDTLETSERHGGKRSGPKGEPLQGDEYGPRPVR